MRNYGRSFVNFVVPRCQGSSAKGYEEGYQVQTAVLFKRLESRGEWFSLKFAHIHAAISVLVAKIHGLKFTIKTFRYRLPRITYFHMNYELLLLFLFYIIYSN